MLWKIYYIVFIFLVPYSFSNKALHTIKLHGNPHNLYIKLKLKIQNQRTSVLNCQILKKLSIPKKYFTPKVV